MNLELWRMESLDRRRTGSEQEEGFGVEARRATDLGMVPNLRRSNSSLHKSRRLLCPFIEKVGSRWLACYTLDHRSSPMVTIG